MYKNLKTYVEVWESEAPAGQRRVLEDHSAFDFVMVHFLPWLRSPRRATGMLAISTLRAKWKPQLLNFLQWLQPYAYEHLPSKATIAEHPVWAVLKCSSNVANKDIVNNHEYANPMFLEDITWLSEASLFDCRSLGILAQMYVMVATGMRLIDSFRLSWGDITRRENRLYISCRNTKAVNATVLHIDVELTGVVRASLERHMAYMHAHHDIQYGSSTKLFHLPTRQRDAETIGEEYFRQMCRNFRHHLRKLCTVNGLPPSYFTGHSCGSGYLATMLVRGRLLHPTKSPQDLLDDAATHAGRWKTGSTAQLKYVRPAIRQIVATVRARVEAKVAAGETTPRKQLLQSEYHALTFTDRHNDVAVGTRYRMRGYYTAPYVAHEMQQALERLMMEMGDVASDIIDPGQPITETARTIAVYLLDQTHIDVCDTGLFDQETPKWRFLRFVRDKALKLLRGRERENPTRLARRMNDEIRNLVPQLLICGALHAVYEASEDGDFVTWKNEFEVTWPLDDDKMATLRKLPYGARGRRPEDAPTHAIGIYKVVEVAVKPADAVDEYRQFKTLHGPVLCGTQLLLTPRALYDSLCNGARVHLTGTARADFRLADIVTVEEAGGLQTKRSQKVRLEQAARTPRCTDSDLHRWESDDTKVNMTHTAGATPTRSTPRRFPTQASASSADAGVSLQSSVARASRTRGLHLHDVPRLRSVAPSMLLASTPTHSAGSFGAERGRSSSSVQMRSRPSEHNNVSTTGASMDAGAGTPSSASPSLRRQPSLPADVDEFSPSRRPTGTTTMVHVPSPASDSPIGGRPSAAFSPDARRSSSSLGRNDVDCLEVDEPPLSAFPVTPPSSRPWNSPYSTAHT